MEEWNYRVHRCLSLVVFVRRYAALMRASQPTFKAPGAIGVPPNGNRQHNRYQRHREKQQTVLKAGLLSLTVTSATRVGG